MSRLLKGWNYFWNLKPSSPITKDRLIFLLHKYQILLRESVGKKEHEELTEENINDFATKLFGKSSS